MPATLTALHDDRVGTPLRDLLGVPRAPTDGITITPASLRRLIMACLGASANEATRTPWAIISSIRSAASGASARRLTPNGSSVRSRTAATAARSASSVIVAEPMMPRPPAREVAAASRAPATNPIPVCTIGYRMPVSSVSLVRIGGPPVITPAPDHAATAGQGGPG